MPEKDFQYYADKAEAQITYAEEHNHQEYNPNLRATALIAAQIFASLAHAAALAAGETHDEKED